MSVNSKMTALADEIRELSGTEEAMGLDAMADHVGEANTDVATEANLIEQIASALEGKAAGGEQATPVISVNSNGLITATAGTKASTHQLAFQPAKTITPSAASQIAVSDGYYTGGDIIVAGDSNLVAGNIKSGVSIFGVNGTLAEGGGGSGEQVEYSENENAMVTGTLSNYFNDKVITIGSGAFFGQHTLISVNFPNCLNINGYKFVGAGGENGAFAYCINLKTVSFPVCTSIGTYAFYQCYNLTTASFPACKSIDANAFENCSSLTTASFPVCTFIGTYAFEDCSRLTTVSFPVCTSIGTHAFYKCYNLKSLYLTGSSLCTLSHSNAFTSTPIGGYSVSAGTYGSIYVPASLLTSYQTATNWTYFSSRFVAYDDNTGDIITFTINGTSYQAENSMTWAEWIYSKYNVDDYIVDPEESMGIMDNQCNGFVQFENNYVGIDETIRDNTNYTFGW